MPDIIADVIRREGDPTDDPIDKGGRTQYGISEAANPEAWADGVVTEDEARNIYTKKYVTFPRFNLLPTVIQPLVIDWGVISGPQLVIMQLQGILKVKADGVIGPDTLRGIGSLTPEGIIRLNNALVSARVKQAGRIVSKDPSQVKYLNGWLNRALEFLL